MAQLIIATILRWKEMRTPCNLLMMNRAKHRDRGPGSEFGNLLLLAHRGLHVKVPLSSARCLRVCVCVSVVTHTIIALERYPAIVRAIMNKISVTITRAVICIMWFSCHGLPIDVIYNAEQQNGKIFCAISFLSKTFHHLSNKRPD